MSETDEACGTEREYIIGLDRNDQHLVAHLYDGDLGNPGKPLCVRGWNRGNGFAYSILRGLSGDAGICRVCARRAALNLPGIEPRKRKTRWL